MPCATQAWPLLALTWKFPEELVPVPAPEQHHCPLLPRTSIEPQGNAHRARVAAVAMSPRLPQESSAAAENENRSRSIDSLLFFGENPGKNNSSVISWKSSSCMGCLAVLRIAYAFIHNKMLQWFITWETVRLHLMSFHYISLLEERHSSLK